MSSSSGRARNVLFFPELQFPRGFVVLEKGAKLRRCFKQPNPLLVVQRNGEAAQTIDTDAPFFADTKLERAGAAPSTLFFHFPDFPPILNPGTGGKFCGTTPMANSTNPK